MTLSENDVKNLNRLRWSLLIMLLAEGEYGLPTIQLNYQLNNAMKSVVGDFLANC